MATDLLEQPKFIKKSGTFEVNGRVWDIDERKVAHLDNRLLGPDFKKLSNKGVDDATIDLLKTTNDPVKWIEKYLVDPNDPTKPLTLRFYQKDILWTPSRYKSLCLGRQVGKSVLLAADMLWRAMTNNSYKIVVICPFQNQIINLFSYIRNIMGTNVRMANIKDVSSPALLLGFKNGSTIKGFVAGDSVRGQTANALYYDEVDFINDDVKSQACDPVVNSIVDHIVVESSTPKRYKSSFYKNFHDQNEFVSFHYPSQVSPSWNEVIENKYLRELSTKAYDHEILAVFGETDGGVFRVADIAKAIESSRVIPFVTDDENEGSFFRSYTYDEFPHYINSVKQEAIEVLPEDKRDSLSIKYVIGVDWNGQANGTQIIVLAHLLGKLYLAEKEDISDDEFTQTMAINKIIDLNKKYSPEAIYVDEGYGSTQIELLKLHGISHPETELVKRVVPVQFNGIIQMPDPFDYRETRKIKIKHFMIDRTQKLMEDDVLVLPSQEDESGGVVEEMRNYIIKRHSAAGEPIYESEIDRDHQLMALVLAVFAFVEVIEKTTKIHYEAGENIFDSGFLDRSRNIHVLKNTGSRAHFIDHDRNEMGNNISNLGVKYEYGGIVDLSQPIPDDDDNGKTMQNVIKFNKTSNNKRARFNTSKNGRGRF